MSVQLEEKPATAVATVPARSGSLIARMADKFGVDPDKMLSTLKATAFRVKDGPEVTNEQMMALLVVADQYGLNPWTKEIYAFPDKNNGIVPVVGVDGWARIINEKPVLDGIEFRESAEVDKAGLPIWIECTIYRKDRAHPTTTREYMAECKRDVAPWRSHPRRMLRHKSMIQTGRIAFGFAGIYDRDEAERIIESKQVTATANADSVNAALASRRKAPALPSRTEITDVEVPTHAEVLAAINTAKTRDELDTAASLIGAIGDEQQRAELTARYQARLKEFEQ